MRFRLLLLVALLARLAHAQVPDTTHRASGSTVSGVVRDSIARRPLDGAIVQIVAADSRTRFGRTVISDSLGRFTLGNVPDGRYTLGFFHPILDSLGIEPPLREVYIDGQRPVRADLGVPSPARLRAAICGDPSGADPGAVVVGIIRDARDRAPAAGVTVTGEWFEFSFKPEGVVHRNPRLVARTGESGWFAICNVPRPGTMALTASRGADSTGRIEVSVPAEGFLRRELYLGSAQPVVTGDAAPGADTVVLPGRLLVRAGDGRLSGTVIASAERGPLAGAQVSIPGGPQTHANERGEWTLLGVPVGTRMLDVRAVGYYPERRRVDVVTGAPSIRVALSTVKAVLDTMKVTANRSMGRGDNGFQDRRRSGVGLYLTPEDIARRQPLVTSDIFRSVPGVRLVSPRGTFGERILMRGASVADACSPTIYLNGQPMYDLSADEIDTWVRPKEIAGIEIYAGPGVPAEYQQGLSGGLMSRGELREPCGSILIWTRRG